MAWPAHLVGEKGGYQVASVLGAGGGRKNVAIIATNVKSDRAVERKNEHTIRLQAPMQYPDREGVWTPGPT